MSPVDRMQLERGAADLYPSSSIKRARRTAAEMDTIRQAILNIVKAGDGMTVRHLFYRLVSAGVIDKTEAEYSTTVTRLATDLRRSGDIPFGKIIDGSRLYTAPTTFSSVADAVRDTAANYRRSYWRTADRSLEVWCEKDAIRALIQDVTWELAVPLMVTRGFSSESVVHSLAIETRRSGKPKVVLSLNDYDPSGSIMLENVLRRARHYAPEAVFHSQQVALTREQVTQLRLPTRPTKRDGNTHAARFLDEESVELDAMDPDELRELLAAAIEQHIDPNELHVIEQAEASEREIISSLVAFTEGAP